jgi:hypothetical protein
MKRTQLHKSLPFGPNIVLRREIGAGSLFPTIIGPNNFSGLIPTSAIVPIRHSAGKRELFLKPVWF